MPNSEPTSNPPTLQGYDLVERIGSGGYGEVWRASAPGGLEKAVKYVFGQQEESRARVELKALEKVSRVRHPFLLSLERIEVLEGRLIVVSELADSSLRDRSDACQTDGLAGIPREELLGYLRDAADALDFLSTRHGLQHLDIKPENLLLLAGHVKVADFGMVKSIDNQAQSLVGGMTPHYAAPEVFKGSPTKYSDQYSLAVMYQELLTGVMPFPGSSAAELTMQHLNEEPDLSSLSEDDRYVLSRALSKNPEHRYGSCRDMVQALMQPSTTASSGESFQQSRAPGLASPNRPTAGQCKMATEVFDDATASNRLRRPMLLDLSALPKPATKHCDVPIFDAETHELSPTVFIGIGGTAGRVLRKLRCRLSKGIDEGAELPAMPMLLLDTDAKSLFAATRTEGHCPGLEREETLSLPLRRAQEYREKTPQLLTWLGRRWLYNMPRSLQTEGIRPLGRLALIDHARQAFSRIREAMTAAIEESNIAATEAALGRKLRRGSLRVYIVSSISGGTGSGMVHDAAYALRTIATKIGVEDLQTLGVLAHCSSREAQRGELARVNAYAWLAEHQHLTRTEVAYLGDESSGLPGHPAGVAPFDHTYVVHLGDGLDDDAFDSGCAMIADYLQADAATGAQGLLEACRHDDADETASLRAFYTARPPKISREALAFAEQTALKHLAQGWLEKHPPTIDASAIVQRLGIDKQSILKSVQQAIGAADQTLSEAEATLRSQTEELTRTLQELLVTLVLDAKQGICGAKRLASQLTEILAATSELFADAADDGDSSSSLRPAFRLAASFADAVAVTSKQLQSELYAAAKLADQWLADDDADLDEGDPWRQIVLAAMPTIVEASRNVLLAETLVPAFFTASQDGGVKLGQIVTQSAHEAAQLLPKTFEEQSADSKFPTPPPAVSENCQSIRKWAVLAKENAQASPGATALPAGEGHDALYAVELSGLSLVHFAANIVNCRRDYTELAERVHTRQDIRWTNLLDCTQKAKPNGSQTFATMELSQSIPVGV